MWKNLHYSSGSYDLYTKKKYVKIDICIKRKPVNNGVGEIKPSLDSPSRINNNNFRVHGYTIFLKEKNVHVLLFVTHQTVFSNQISNKTEILANYTSAF